MIKLCLVGVLSNDANAHQKLFIPIDEFEISENIYIQYIKNKIFMALTS